LAIVAPKWVIEPNNIDAIIGSDAVLHCKADAIPPPIITWRKVGSESEFKLRSVLLKNHFNV